MLNMKQVGKHTLMVDCTPSNSIWFYYYPELPSAADKVANFSQDIFQRKLTDEEYSRLVDARTGEIVRIYADTSRTTGTPIPTIRIKLMRTVLINKQKSKVEVEYWLSNNGSRPVLTLMDFEVPPIAQGKGLATQMFATQVAAAHDLGFNEIVAYADYRNGRNGYYTWPRLGFDKPLTLEERNKLPFEFNNFTSLGAILDNPEGRKWWSEHGSTLGFDLETTFDISPQSRSINRLQSAVTNFNQKKEFWDSGPSTPIRIERGASLRPRRDWEARVWEYKERNIECQT